MEEQAQVIDSGVTASVAGEQTIETAAPETTATPTETGVTPDVAGQESGEKQNLGPVITAEVARREAALQKKYEEQYGAHQRNLERTARYYGFDNVDDYVTALDQAERDRQIEQEAEALGVDRSVISEHLAPLREKVSSLEKTQTEYEQLKQQLEIQKEVTDLRAKYSDFDQYAQKIVDLAAKGYSLEDSYVLASYQDKISKLEKETEAKTIRNLQANAASTPGSLGAGDVEHNVGFGSLPIEEQRKIIADVKAGRRKTL